MSDNEKRKNKFRSSKKWKQFRKDLKKKQKTDPITGAKLGATAVCHHLSLKPEEYEMLSEDRQVMLNHFSHKCLHYIYGDGNKYFDWRTRIAKLVELCERMDELNKEKHYVE
jgi:hypothetical protein